MLPKVFCSRLTFTDLLGNTVNVVRNPLLCRATFETAAGFESTLKTKQQSAIAVRNQRTARARVSERLRKLRLHVDARLFAFV